MRVQLRTTLAWATCAALALGPACGQAGGFAGPTPVALLPSSPQSAAAFDAIRAAWNDPARSKPETLRSMLDGFLARYPNDDVAPIARVALALVALRQHDLEAADVELARSVDLPAGTARDLRTVARAQRLRLGGNPEASLALLRPLVGKSVDPIARSIFEEELSLTALATHRDYEAISYMDAWLRVSGEDDKASVVERVAALVARLPEGVLIGALRAMRSHRTSLGYGVDIQRILAQRLVHIAATSGDAQLARMLLDEDSDGESLVGNAITVLGELANSRRGLNIVDGRTVGLLLPTESPGLRDESADVLRGVMWALGLPRGVRTRPDKPRAIVGAGSSADAIRTCAAPEAAPDVDEPVPDSGLRLVTRNDAGSTDRTEVSLDELAGEGAGIIIAGLDGLTAARALRWAEGHSLAVVVLVPPGEPPDAPGFGFVLGEPRADVIRELVRAAPLLADQRVTPLADTSELERLSPDGGGGGGGGGLNLAAPVSCDITAPWAGEPRFPIASWRADKMAGWLVSGSPGCSSDVVSELTAARAQGTVALTLEAAALPPHPAGLRVISAQAGVVPGVGPGDPRQEELERFSVTLGPVGWWTALGRDASTLARLAVQQLPSDEVSDMPSVSARRVQSRDALAAARTRLWTTEESGWAPGHTVRRTVCAIDVPMR